jgi:hypothetical protein
VMQIYHRAFSVLHQQPLINVQCPLHKMSPGLNTYKEATSPRNASLAHQRSSSTTDDPLLV